MKKLKVLFAALALVPAIWGCVPLTPLPPEEISLQSPTLKPLNKEMEDQKKGAVHVSIAPFTYQASVQGIKEFMSGGGPYQGVTYNSNGTQSAYIYFQANGRYRNVVVLDPERVKFKVKLTNQLDHTIKLDGTLVQFRVAGVKVDVDKVNYSDFLNGILTPGEENEFVIAGPPIANIPAGTTVALLLYDLVTKTNAAGEPTQRSKFEFVYKLRWKQEMVQVEQKRGFTAQIDGNQNAFLLSRGGGNSWVEMPGW